MGAFTENVRSGKIKAPQQRGFDSAKWEQYFSRLGNDDEDKRLYLSGNWFANEFNLVRKITEQGIQNFQWSHKNDRIAAFVGYAIREWTTILHYVRDQMKKSGNAGGFFLSELDEVPVKSPFYEKVDAQGSIESIVDGLRYPISLDHLAVAPKTIRGCGTLNDVHGFMTLVHMGQYYHYFEQRWLDCIWNEHFVQESDSAIIIRPHNIERNRCEAISEFRRHSIAFETIQRASAMWQSQLGEEFKSQILNKQGVLSVFKRNGKFRIKPAKAERFEQRLPSVSIPRMMLVPDHALPLLNKKLPSLNNLTLGKILDAYDLVSQIPDQISRYLPEDSGIYKPEVALSRYCGLLVSA